MNRQIQRSLASIGCLALAVLVFGCGEPNPLGRRAVSGEVIFDGGPLEYGMIEFSPKDPAGHSSGSSIVDGKYEIASHQGLPPGEYTVRITSPTNREPDEIEPELLPPGPQEGARQPPPAVERIPAEFNTKSIQVVEVTQDSKNKFDFDIPSSKKKR